MGLWRYLIQFMGVEPQSETVWRQADKYRGSAGLSL